MRAVPIIPFLVLWLGCGDPPMPPASTVELPGGTDSSLLEVNRSIARREAADIDAWMRRQGLVLETTGTGVRYRLFRDVAGPPVRPGQYATVAYTLMLLNGDTAYRSNAPESFLVEEDHVESGLHEAIQFMSPGDSALIVIPSHRAHGLLGDRERIPALSTVVYSIGLRSVR